MRNEIIRKLTKLNLINRTLGLSSDLLKPSPNHHRTSDMITLDTPLTTLTAFNPRDLLGFTMKLLNLPIAWEAVMAELAPLHKGDYISTFVQIMNDHLPQPVK